MDILSSIYLHAVAVSALATVALLQILKLRLFPPTFANKYPVPTLIVLSVAAAIWTVLRSSVAPKTWTDWVVLTGTIGVVAALTYRTTIANWAELREIESKPLAATARR